MNLVAKPGRRMDEVGDEEFLSYFQSEPCRRRSDYRAIIDNWSSAFPGGQLFTAFLDDIEEAPRDVLASLFDYLGVTRPVNWDAFSTNSTVVPHYESNRMVYRGEVPGAYESSDRLLPGHLKRVLEEMYADQIEELGQRYNAPVHRWRSQPIASTNSSGV